MSYVIVVVPTVIPPTIPVPAPTVPTAGLLLLHVPPGSASVKVIVAPRQTTDKPLIAPGVGVIVTTATELQPATVYNIVTVPGVPPAVTTPLREPTVAIAGVTLLQVPPGVPQANVVE